MIHLILQNLMDSIFSISFCGFPTKISIRFACGLFVGLIKNSYPLLSEPFICKFHIVEWNEVMMEDEFIVPKLVLNVLKMEMI